MARKKDVDWNVGGDGGSPMSWDGCQLAVLMDIRDELKALNRTFNCGNFQQMPRDMAAIRRALEYRPRISTKQAARALARARNRRKER